MVLIKDRTKIDFTIWVVYFDVSIPEVAPDNNAGIITNGDTLGGDDFDQVIANGFWMVKKIKVLIWAKRPLYLQLSKKPIQKS